MTYPYLLFEDLATHLRVMATEPCQLGQTDVTYTLYVTLPIPDGIASAVYQAPSGLWYDHEGFIPEELEKLSEFLRRKNVSFTYQLSQVVGMPTLY